MVPLLAVAAGAGAAAADVTTRWDGLEGLASNAARVISLVESAEPCPGLVVVRMDV